STRAGLPRITLLSRPGCHLCDDAREVIAKVAADLGGAWDERDITVSDADLREYWDKIPVTLVDGTQHDFWRVSEARLRQALRLTGPVPCPRPASWARDPVPPVGIRSQTTYSGGAARLCRCAATQRVPCPVRIRFVPVCPPGSVA